MIMERFTILLLLGAHGVQKGVDTSERTTPEDKRISCAIPHRVELRSGESIDGVILRLSLKVSLAEHFHASMSETYN